jgi:hypothetical protein
VHVCKGRDYQTPVHKTTGLNAVEGVPRSGRFGSESKTKVVARGLNLVAVLRLGGRSIGIQALLYNC